MADDKSRRSNAATPPVPTLSTSRASERLNVNAAMLEFEFSLRFQLDDDESLLSVVMDKLDVCQSTPGLVGASLNGYLELQFVRPARSAEQALNSATASVKRAFPSARLMKIVPAPDTPSASHEE